MADQQTGRITTYDNDGLTFDVLDQGPLDGEVVVLLHGFPERASCWRLVAPLLHAQGYRTLAPDQRGYSPGARPRRRRDYRMELLAGDVASLIARAGGTAHVVGHDWGSAAAFATAIRHPEAVRTVTAISGAHPGAFRMSLLSSRQILKSWYFGAFQLPRVPELVAARPGGPFDRGLRRSGMSRDDVGRVRTEVVDDGALPGGLGWYRAASLSDAGLFRESVLVPTTLLWSDGDAFVGRGGVDRTQDFVDAPYELVVLPDVSHWIPTQAPEAAAQAILRRIAS